VRSLLLLLALAVPCTRPADRLRAGDPAHPAAAPAAGASQPADSRVALRIETDPPGQRFYLETGAAQLTRPTGRIGGRPSTARDFDLICIAPCDALLAEGIHRFAVEHGTELHEFDRPIKIRGPGLLRTTLESHAEHRIIGSVVGAAAVIAGMVMLVVAISEEPTNGGLLLAGSLAGLGGLVFAIVSPPRRRDAHRARPTAR
jgi:hypothetical protein